MSSLAIGQSQLTTDFRAPRDSRWKSCEGELNRLHVDERRMREGCGNEPMVRAGVCADDSPLRVRERVYHSGAPRAAGSPCRSHLPDRTGEHEYRIRRSHGLAFRRTHSSWAHDKGVPGKVIAALIRSPPRYDDGQKSPPPPSDVGQEVRGQR
jgi:hypothetical protein